MPTRENWVDAGKIYAKFFAGATFLAAALSFNPYVQTLPQANEEELQQLESFNNNPKAIQKWIDKKDVKYTFDKEQFGGVFCDGNDDKCDVWASGINFLRSKKGDCDEVLALSHYSLGKEGIGLFLGYEGKIFGHAVYIYKGNNGFYGIISINESEAREAKYSSIEEAALSFVDSKYNYYKYITLPEDDEILLYSYEGIREKSSFGKAFYFPKKD